MVSKCRRFAVLTKHKSAKKTKKPRVIYFGPKTKAWLESQKKSTGFVFTNRFGKQYTKDSVRQRIARLREKLGIKDVVAYSYRHAFPARSIMQGVDIATVAELMGHSSLEMLSRVYGHLEREQKHLMEASQKISHLKA